VEALHEMSDEKQEDHQAKYQEEAMDVYGVRLPCWHARMARRLGLGNLSRGIRIAIEKAMGEKPGGDQA
jgi:hypothetical protein